MINLKDRIQKEMDSLVQLKEESYILSEKMYIQGKLAGLSLLLENLENDEILEEKLSELENLSIVDISIGDRMYIEGKKVGLKFKNK